MPVTQTSVQTTSETSSTVKRPDEARANRARRPATDDEILGTGGVTKRPDANPMAAAKPAPDGRDGGQDPESIAEHATDEPETEPENLRGAFDANPELRQAWQDAQAYRETFATPDDARAATALLADLDRMDALFFSRRPEDHVALARSVADLDPAAFASLARAMNELAAERREHRDANAANQDNAVDKARATASTNAGDPRGRNHSTVAQEEFFHATNAAAVQSVLDAIESQVERLLPESASRSARNRVVGEIYRELDNILRSNRQLTQQMREAFRSGALDADHQRAIVTLINGRARQALPGVAKRVLSEWTSTVVAANQERRARQRTAERRVDIAGSNGSGNDGRRPTTPRDIDYARMSDADILNL
jgi:hypothetical protein